ncbi:carbohydrate kinase family protein [Halobaculum roseum]|uniref:Carbohydrate kinase family protein n=1 Tax=Halobaculum roseum TaxID=2175149 RepID=A0ABD5MSR6_9EURY|nr:carbohydrate kinase [Halobaculum roseum]QZY03640.1 carbohydrate kinase [Halobaculum roseum]
MTRLVVGECIVDLHPAAASAGDLGDADAYARHPGGAPANVAVGLARLGEAPGLWTRLGDDGFGDFLADTLRGEGIPETFVERDPDAPTGLALVALDADGERSFSLYLEGTAAAALDPATVDDATLADLDWIHVGGVELAHEPSRSAVFDLLDRVPDAATVSFDPNARPSLWREFDYADTLARALPDVDVLVASAEDLDPAGYEGTAEALASGVVADGPHTAVITRGAAGAYARSTADAPWGAGHAEHPGFEADVVDTTGAGDAFTAGAIAALDGGSSLSDALRFANAVGARATTAQGAMAALPTRAEVEAFLDGEGDR